MTKNEIDLPRVTTREEWLDARVKLLDQEKALTEARDRLNAERRRLPMVAIDQPYWFTGPDGEASLADLFEGRRQLILYHFMWLWKAGQPLDRGCPSCSAWADQLARGHLQHVHLRDTALVLVSRAPYASIEKFRARMGWNVPWYSSWGSDFNFDFGVSFDEKHPPESYNYRSRADHEKAGTDYYLTGDLPFDLPGISCFLRDGDRVFHTYSTYGRGGETIGGAYYFLDLTALGRQEEWEEPKGRALGAGAKAGSDRIRYPDEYGPEAR